jgi:hypothetical protein
MKNLFIYYLVIIIPLILIFILLYLHYTMAFGICLIVYAIVFRPITDGLRLLAMGRIQKPDFGKLFIPFWSIKWFRSLYFKSH